MSNTYAKELAARLPDIIKNLENLTDSELAEHLQAQNTRLTYDMGHGELEHVSIPYEYGDIWLNTINCSIVTDWDGSLSFSIDLAQRIEKIASTIWTTPQKRSI